MKYISSSRLAHLWQCPETLIVLLAAQQKITAKKINGKWLCQFPQQKPF